MYTELNMVTDNFIKHDKWLIFLYSWTTLYQETSICLRRHGYPARHVVKKVNKKVNLSFSDEQTLTKEPIFSCNILSLI